MDDDAGNDTTPEITDVEPLSDARTMLVDCVNRLLMEFSMLWAGEDSFGISCKKFGSVKRHELEQLIDDYEEGEGYGHA